MDRTVLTLFSERLLHWVAVAEVPERIILVVQGKLA
jgi:hypothetical protein